MDRNENQNSYQNTRRGRGSAKVAESLKRRVNFITALVILLLAGIAALFYLGKQNVDEIKTLKEDMAKLEKDIRRLSKENEIPVHPVISATPMPEPTLTPIESEITPTPEATPTPIGDDLTPTPEAMIPDNADDATEMPEVTPPANVEEAPTPQKRLASDALALKLEQDNTGFFEYKNVRALFPIEKNNGSETGEATPDVQQEKTREFVVAVLQSWLQDNEYLEAESIDGKFGQITEEALERYAHDKNGKDLSVSAIDKGFYDEIVTAEYVDAFDISGYIAEKQTGDVG